jgi:hypothetical protein
MPPTRRTERPWCFGSAAALHLVHGLVASTRALSMRVTLRTRSPGHPQVPRSKPQRSTRWSMRSRTTANTSVNHTLIRATPSRWRTSWTRGSSVRGASRAGPTRMPSAPAQTSLGMRVGVRRARRRKTRATLAQPPNLQAPRPGAGCTPNRRADHAITSSTTPGPDVTSLTTSAHEFVQ